MVRLCVQVVEVVEQQGGQLPCMDVPALLHLYKARLAMACSNQKAAKKEVGAASHGVYQIATTSHALAFLTHPLGSVLTHSQLVLCCDSLGTAP